MCSLRQRGTLTISVVDRLTRTINDVHVGPEGCARSDYSCTVACECCLDEDGDLDRHPVRDSGVDELMGCGPVDGGRKDEVRSQVSLLIRLHDVQVDGSVLGAIGDGLQLFDIEIVEDGVHRVFALRVVVQSSRSGLIGCV